MTMGKSALINQVITVLDEAGFSVSEQCTTRPSSFDLAARREEILLLLGVRSNIDAMNKEAAEEMRYLSKYLLGSPLVIGERAGDAVLRTGVIYKRYDVPSISIFTLHDFVANGILPYVYSAPGGLHVSIDGELLRENRLDKNMSLGELASHLGTSRRSISKYEEGMDATLEAGLILEEILESMIISPIDILKPRPGEEVEREIDLTMLSSTDQKILSSINEMGFEVFPTQRAPFKAVSMDKTATLLTGISRYCKAMIKKAMIMSSISTVTETHSVFIVDGKVKSTNIGETILVEKRELDQVKDTEEFIDLVEERRE